jgi:CHAT domain-containing protein
LSFLRSAKITLLFGISILICLITSSRQVEAQNSPSKRSQNSQDKPEFRSLRAEGNKLYAAGRFREASDVYERGYRAALRQREMGSAIRFLNNLAGCRFALFDYRQALVHYLEAQRIAAAVGDREMYATLAMNIASMRVVTGDRKLAAMGLQTAAAALPQNAEHLHQLLIQLGFIHAQSGDFDRALPYFEKGLAEADRRGDERMVAKALDHLGYQYLRQNRLEEAEACLIEAYRRRLMRRDPELAVSYPKLGMLRLAQGDAVSASNLLHVALAAKSLTSSAFPAAELHYSNALVKRKLGRDDEALTELREAFKWSRSWRRGVLPSDSARTASGIGLLQNMLDTFLDTAADVQLDQRREDLAEEMFQATEEQRAASLRESIDAQGQLADHLPPEYPETLARLRAAEVAVMREESTDSKRLVTALLNEIAEMETRAGLQLVPRETSSGNPFSRRAVQRRLSPAQVLFSIHAGQEQSYLWAITAEKSWLYRLAGKQHLLDLARHLSFAVNAESTQSAASWGARLYGELFGGVGEWAVEKPEWLVVLDTPLFEAPLAALVMPGAGTNQTEYVIERHSLRLLPGVWALLGEEGTTPASKEAHSKAGAGGFLGLGDSVYNKADSRWGGRPPRSAAIENARLVGSAREVEACARAYGARQSTVLTGWDASRARLESALAGHPDVLHIAAHVLHSRGPEVSALIHLGLRPSGEAEVLNPSDIVFLSGSPRLVVMSGCASGSAEAIPGEGLMGLTRAWLINGADAVTASYWPTTDDQGEIFLSFYRHLAARGSAADSHVVAGALQAAQLEMMRSGGWRSAPKYWAAFFVIGRS